MPQRNLKILKTRRRFSKEQKSIVVQQALELMHGENRSLYATAMELGVCQCVTDDSVEHCGSSCDPCPDDPHGTPTCDSSACGLSCDTGYLSCDGSCKQCPPDPEITGVRCVQGACHIESCAPNFWPCGTSCCAWEFLQLAPTAFNFDLILDGDGHPHVAYVASGLRYASFDGVQWNFDTVGVNGRYPSIATDSQDLPLIAFVDADTSELSVAAWTGQAWIIQGVGVDAIATQIVIAPGDEPHVVYVDEDTGFLSYARLSSGSWTQRTVDSSCYAGNPSIELAPGGELKVAYRDLDHDYTLKLAIRSSNGSNWTREVVTPNRVGFPHLAVDGAGGTHVGYRELDSGVVKHAVKTGGTWEFHDIPAVDAQRMDLDVTVEGVPYVVYMTTEVKSSLFFVYQAADVWIQDLVTEDAWLNCKIVMGAAGAPHLLFDRDILGGAVTSLMYAK